MNNTKTNASGRKALFGKEDSWAIWIGFAVIAVGLTLWALGTNMEAIVVSFDTYDNFYEIPGLLMPIVPHIVLLYIILTTIFTFAMAIMGHDTLQFLKGFSLLFALALLVHILGSWSVAVSLSLETPVIALLLGMIIGNFIHIPNWFDSAMRTEFYVKTGIVLMGATLPFSLILQAGPIALAQASIVAVTTFGVIYFFGAHVFKLEKPFAATLGVGGSVCGISASIAVASSVNAKKSHVSMAITLIVIWATIMVFLLPIICHTLGIGGGVAGAWIGSSEFADAAGAAAAAQFGDSALATFSLVKILGRDVFVGIWAFILAIVYVTVWETKDGKDDGTQKPSAKIMWERFPKFVLGFIVSSIIISVISLGLGPETTASLNTAVVEPIRNLRSWAFILCFLCIGMTTRFMDLAATGWKPIAAFSIGVLVNFVLGFFISTAVLADYWSTINY